MNKNDIKKAEQILLDAEKQAEILTKSLENAYRIARINVEKELMRVYLEYGDGEVGLTINDIKKELGKGELRDFKKDVDEMLKFANKKGDNNYISKLNRLYNRTRVTRLEQLAANIDYELQLLSNKSLRQFDRQAKIVYENSLLKTVYNIDTRIGFESAFTKPNYKMMEVAVNRKWLGENFEGRIGVNRDRLNSKLNQRMLQGIAMGKNSREIAKDLNKTMKTGFNNAHRLANTELANIAGEATYKGYMESKSVQQYQFLATLDDKTSDTCSSLDLEIFNKEDRIVGVNYPPIHPFCRSTTIPYFEDDEIDALFKESYRVSRNKQGKGHVPVNENMSYNEWKKQRGF